VSGDLLTPVAQDVERRETGHEPSGRRRGTAWVTPLWVASVCLVVTLSRLPFLRSPLSPDEGGFLVVGGHWAPGTSLYGDYWVDRPPLLIGVFTAAEALGGPLALRVFGLLAVALAVGAAAVVGWHASGRRRTGAVVGALTCATFLVSPLFGTRIVDGELLASPLVLGGLAALLASYGGAIGTRVVLLRALAGALGAAAFLIKQDMVDVLVVVAVLAMHPVQRRGVRSAATDLVPVLAGAVATASAVTAWAASRGTPLTGLWAAVVTFRLAATGVVGFSGPRLSELGHAYVVTGALTVTVVATLVCLSSRRRVLVQAPASVPWCTTALALTSWELVAVLAGGSYWSHYLVGLVPGITFLVAVALGAPGRLSRWALAASLTYAALASAVSWSMQATVSTTQTDDQVAASYVRHHARPGDSVVVAFGHADIVEDSGLGSPYPYLWALPAFVEDPRLLALDRLLVSPAAPRWFVAGGDLSQWGAPGARVQHLLDRHYTVVLRTRRWVVLRQHVAGSS
jgi:hypothetical protein